MPDIKGQVSDKEFNQIKENLGGLLLDYHWSEKRSDKEWLQQRIESSAKSICTILSLSRRNS